MLVKSFVLFVLAGCSSLLYAAEAAAGGGNSSTRPLVTVNGEVVGDRLFSAYRQSRQPGQVKATDDAARQLAVLNELVNFVLLAQDALAKELEKQPKVATELHLARTRLLANAAIARHLAAQPISEQALRSAYEAHLEGRAVDEFKVSHILLQSADAAEPVIEALRKGQPFAELAKRYSVDASAADGGRLGWLSPGQIDPAIASTLQQLTAGEYSEQPVKTEYGWHLLLLEQQRRIPQPGYGEMRAALLQAKQKEILTDYIKGLRSAARLELHTPAARETPAEN